MKSEAAWGWGCMHLAPRSWTAAPELTQRGHALRHLGYIPDPNSSKCCACLGVSTLSPCRKGPSSSICVHRSLHMGKDESLQTTTARQGSGPGWGISPQTSLSPTP